MTNTIHTSDAVKLAWGYKDLTDMVDGRMVEGATPGGFTKMMEKFVALQERTGVVLANESYLTLARVKAHARDEKAREIVRKIFGGK
jgi:hypothetical protein